MNTKPIEDVQGRADARKLRIDKVGIKDIKHPVRIADRDGGEQHTVATFNLYVDLPHNFKGTHMSRFVEILNRHEREISVQSFREMLTEVTDRLEAEVDSGMVARIGEIQARSGNPLVSLVLVVVRKKLARYTDTTIDLNAQMPPGLRLVDLSMDAGKEFTAQVRFA